MSDGRDMKILGPREIIRFTESPKWIKRVWENKITENAILETNDKSIFSYQHLIKSLSNAHHASEQDDHKTAENIKNETIETLVEFVKNARGGKKHICEKLTNFIDKLLLYSDAEILSLTPYELLLIAGIKPQPLKLKL